MSFEVSKKIEKVSQKLCSTILREAGGSGAISNSLGTCERQYVYRWIKIGAVSPKFIYEVSKLLNTTPWALSYAHFLGVFGEEETPPLAKIIKQSPITKQNKLLLLTLLS